MPFRIEAYLITCCSPQVANGQAGTDAREMVMLSVRSYLQHQAIWRGSVREAIELMIWL